MLKTIAKRMVVGTPLEAPLRRLFGAKPIAFEDSSQYWIERYSRVATSSGAGSYGRLAEFKAEVLNDFVAKNDIQSILELGSGDGNQATLAEYPAYHGFDISPDAVEFCRKRFADNPTMKFSLISELGDTKADLALSLDVIYHLVEDTVFDTYMRQLFGAADRFVSIYASNQVTSPLPDAASHVRHRKFTDWVETNAPEWEQTLFIKNRFPFDTENVNNTSFADFYFFARK